MRIRSANETDLAAAAQLWFERMSLLRESDPNLRLAPMAVSLWRERATGWMHDPDCGFFVATSESDVAGLLVVGAKDNLPWLLPARIGRLIEMTLDLHQSRGGLSRALLERAIDWLRARDIAVLEIQPWSRYPVEEAFWRAQGARQRASKFWLKL